MNGSASRGFFINSDGKVYSYTGKRSARHYGHVLYGNYFKTEEEAEIVAEAMSIGLKIIKDVNDPVLCKNVMSEVHRAIKRGVGLRSMLKRVKLLKKDK